MSSTKQYSDISSLENYLLIDIDASFESQVETWISAAEEYVDNYTGYTTASGMWNESIVNELSEARVDGDHSLVIHPRKSPVNSVSAIGINKGTQTITLNLTDGDGVARYILPSHKRVIIYPSNELSTTGSLVLNDFVDIKYSRFYTKISYIAGYTSIPKIVSLATTMISADSVMRQANKEGLTALTQGKLSKRWAERRDGKSEWILDAEEYLKPYRLNSNWV
jgi:hypothetical protein